MLDSPKAHFLQPTVALEMSYPYLLGHLVQSSEITAMDSTLLPDLQLVARGDEHAIKQLFSSEYPHLLGYLRREGITSSEAEDVALDVFSKVILSLRETASLPELSELKTFRLYMLRMARNALSDHFRRIRLQSDEEERALLVVSGHSDEGWFPPNDQVDNAAESAWRQLIDQQAFTRAYAPQENQLAITRAFARLEREYPTGVDLIRLIAEGASSEEVAAFFGCSVGAARERISEALSRLHVILMEEGVHQ